MTMTSETPKVTTQAQVQLDQILESAVILSWDALTASAPNGRVRVEYHIGADGALESLKLWASAREYWSLICDYSIHPGWSDGPRFQNGFHSRGLGRLLQSIMMNQTLFGHTCEANSNGLLEVGAPSPEDIGDATVQVNETFRRTA
jgi:hypothetical protein